MPSNVIFDCDDDSVVELQWTRQLEKVAKLFDLEVKALNAEDLLGEITILRDRQREARRSKDPKRVVQFEQANLLIVDSDLINLGGSFDPNGDDIAYLARAFSNSGPVIILNREGGDDVFDLEVLRRSPYFDDLSISSQSIDSGSLWEGAATYHPWMWPSLSKLSERLEAATAIVDRNLDMPILEVLRLEEFKAQIPKASYSFVVDEKGVPRTFADLALSKESGLWPKDIGTIPKANLPRFAASRVLSWINRQVLPTQYLLVDCPHLITNCPSLLKEGIEIKSIGPTNWKHGERDIVKCDSVKVHEYDGWPWLDRKVWLWPRICEDSSILDISNPFDRPELGAVFCENLSRFVQNSDAMAFTSRIDQTIIRFVSTYEWNAENGLEGLLYAPISNLLRW